MDAEFVEHIPCPECDSSDANALYDDGHSYCFSCDTYFPSESEKPPAERTKPGRKKRKGGSTTPDIDGEYRDLQARGISKATCKLFDYTVGRWKGSTVQVANYRDAEGNVAAQKLRTAGKDFVYLGEPSKCLLFGQHAWTHHSGGRMIVITEGEIDAMTVSELQGNRYPVVSIPTGAKGAKKALKRHMDWLSSFERIVLMFDGDENGKDAVEQVAPLFSPGQVFVAELPDGHDPNSMHVNGRGREVISAAWRARQWRPGTILTMEDIQEDVLKPVEWGINWPWESLTAATYGRRRGEVYTIGAGTGIGKTDVVTQLVAFTIHQQELPVGCIMLEQQARETGQRVAGKIAERRFHVPDAEWTEEELRSTVQWMTEVNRLHLYGGWDGSWEELESVIRYWAADGIQDVVVDHLTAIVADAEDERKELEEVMKQISHLAVQLNITIYLISHLATPEGKPHEEGGRVMLRHFKGSRAIGFWTFFAFGLERNQQDESAVERNTTYLRILKDRYTGQSVGTLIPLYYEQETGILRELSSDGYWDDDWFADESQEDF